MTFPSHNPKSHQPDNGDGDGDGEMDHPQLLMTFFSWKNLLFSRAKDLCFVHSRKLSWFRLFKLLTNALSPTAHTEPDGLGDYYSSGHFGLPSKCFNLLEVLTTIVLVYHVTFEWSIQASTPNNTAVSGMIAFIHLGLHFHFPVQLLLQVPVTPAIQQFSPPAWFIHWHSKVDRMDLQLIIWGVGFPQYFFFHVKEQLS